MKTIKFHDSSFFEKSKIFLQKKLTSFVKI